MRNDKRMTGGFGVWVSESGSRSRAAIRAVLLAGGLLLGGCGTDSSSPFGSGKWRTFGSAPSPTPAPAAADANRRAEPAKAARREDPTVARTQQKVDSEVERMRQAMEQSLRQSSTGVVAKATPVYESSDSLAAKLAAPQAPPPAAKSESPTTRPAGSTAADASNAERPVIRRTPRPAKAETPIAKTPEKAPPGTAARRSAPIEITAVEPVNPATPAPRAPSDPVAETELEPAPANTAAKLDIALTEDPEAAMDRVIRQLEQRVKDRPADTGAQLKLRLIYTVRGQWQQALKDKGEKNTPTDELAKNVASLVKAYESGDGNPAQQANEALRIINRMKEILSRQADLVISNMQLCWKVDSYGSFKVMPADYFVTGKKLPVIVYLELENFTSKYLPDKKAYQTLLSMGIEVLDGTGRRLWGDQYDKIEDLASRQRRDFFLGTRVTLPATLPEGKLQLKVTLEDQHGNKASQKMIAFEMRGK